jgi:predicted phosphodiesterase
MKKILIVGDNHGDKVDLRCRDALFDFKSDFKPNVLVHLGDAWDYGSLRRGASAEEKSEHGKADHDEGKAFLKEFFKGKAEKHFVWGNHDMRPLDNAESTVGVMREHCENVFEDQMRTLRQCKVKDTDLFYDSRNGVCEIYPFRFVHGYASAENAAKQHATMYGGKFPAVIAGHNHYSQYWREASLDTKEGWSCPCMCDLDPDYARKNKRKLRHNTGWMYGWYDKEDYQLFTVEKRGNQYVAATQIKSF